MDSTRVGPRCALCTEGAEDAVLWTCSTETKGNVRCAMIGKAMRVGIQAAHVVVPSPAASLVLFATSCTSLAPMFSNLSSSSTALATVTPSLVTLGPPYGCSIRTVRPCVGWYSRCIEVRVVHMKWWGCAHQTKKGSLGGGEWGLLPLACEFTKPLGPVHYFDDLKLWPVGRAGIAGCHSRLCPGCVSVRVSPLGPW